MTDLERAQRIIGQQTLVIEQLVEKIKDQAERLDKLGQVLLDNAEAIDEWANRQLEQMVEQENYAAQVAHEEAELADV